MLYFFESRFQPGQQT
jgi:hypothetical protein